METDQNLFWSKWGIYVTIICTVLGLLVGSFYTKWVAIDTQKEYQKQLVNNAIREVEYNLQISWYNTDKYIETPNIFPKLRTSALWEVYYNSNYFWNDDDANKDKLLECLNEIDWNDRLIPLQYQSPFILQQVDNSSEDVTYSDLVQDRAEKEIHEIHQALYDKYNSSIKYKLEKVKTYLVQTYLVQTQ